MVASKFISFSQDSLIKSTSLRRMGGGGQVAYELGCVATAGRETNVAINLTGSMGSAVIYIYIYIYIYIVIMVTLRISERR